MSESEPAKVLIVDDEVELMRALRDALASHGFAPTGLTDPRQASAQIRSESYDLLITDMMMPHVDGLNVLKDALQIDPNLTAIVMTGHGTISTAIEAIKSGAYDYILKPFKLQTILPVLQRGIEIRRLKLENIRLRRFVERLSFESGRYTLIGDSPGMRAVVRMIEKVAPTNATVLIRGPSGAGKELVARALHHNSLRRDGPLVAVNCAALQESLLESELFGHEKGAFTGADKAKPGLFEIAEGGTLFIDEVAEMAPAMQAKFLRVLEGGHFRRVGGVKELKTNARVIAATNKALEEEQTAGRFREDLFYRLNVITITIPPLQERRDDIPALVQHLLVTMQPGSIVHRVDQESMAALIRYDWPGNVRELANVIERAKILAESDRITLADLPNVVASRGLPAPSAPDASLATLQVSRDQPRPASLKIKDQECTLVREALKSARGNKVAAARLLGVSPRALYRLITKHRLTDQISSRDGDSN